MLSLSSPGRNLSLFLFLISLPPWHLTLLDFCLATREDHELDSSFFSLQREMFAVFFFFGVPVLQPPSVNAWSARLFAQK